MTRYLLEIRSKALAGREDEYDAWYESTHRHDVLIVPGFLACTRYETTDARQGTREFVALYEVETDDPPALLERLFAAEADMAMTDAIDPASARFQFLKPVGAERSIAA